MESVKLTKLSGDMRGFDMWEKQIRAFGLMQSWAPAMLKDDTPIP
jgi:hypothetical protein